MHPMDTEFHLWQLTPDIIVLQSAYRHTTAAVVRTGSGALLIDPGIFPDELNALRCIAEHWGGARHAVLTHSHWECMLGTALFPQIEWIAHQSFLTSYVRQEVARLAAGHPPTPEVVREIYAARGVEHSPFQVPTPTRVFATELRLKLDACTVQLLHLPGHSNDAIAVLLVEAGVLFVGDMLSDRDPPLVVDADAYFSSLDCIEIMVAAKQVHTIVPSHGRILRNPREITALIAADRSYVAGVRSTIMRAIRKHQAQVAARAPLAQPVAA